MTDNKSEIDSTKLNSPQMTAELLSEVYIQTKINRTLLLQILSRVDTAMDNDEMNKYLKELREDAMTEWDQLVNKQA